MLSRRAILIGNNRGYNAPTFLKGVDKDLINYNNFLMSDIGGKWLQSEIKIMYNQNRREILNAINNCYEDYSFVVFSGHGFINSNDNLTYICVKDNYITEDELNTDLIKQTLILDCCREVSYEGIGFTGESFEKGDPETKYIRTRSIFNPRQKFNDALLKSSNGQFRGYACAVDESAGDNPLSGGIYSNALLKIGIQFGLRNQLKRNWISIKSAHNLASNNVVNDPFTDQTPLYLTIPTNLKLSFPFAVSNIHSLLW